MGIAAATAATTRICRAVQIEIVNIDFLIITQRRTRVQILVHRRRIRIPAWARLVIPIRAQLVIIPKQQPRAFHPYAGTPAVQSYIDALPQLGYLQRRQITIVTASSASLAGYFGPPKRSADAIRTRRCPYEHTLGHEINERFHMIVGN